MTEQDLGQLPISPADQAAMDAAARRQAQLAKPPGSLGRLEEMSIRMAGITGQVCNAPDRCRVVVFAADNGVIAEGVASTPEIVTLTQSINMTKHLTGMSALAQYFGDSVVVVDVGIRNSGEYPGILNRKIRLGTGNFAKVPAMTRQEALNAIAVGLDLAAQAKAEGIQLLGIGEMGVGNTTSSAAVLAALTGAPASAVTGRGAGLTDAAFARKKAVIDGALRLHRPNAQDPIDVLSKVGGLDLAAMTGAYLGCAAAKLPAVVDGFISIVAALCAVRLRPAVRDYLFLSHVSREPGYTLAQALLGLSPCLMLDMGLGEGSGCPLAFQILKAACAVMSNMAAVLEADLDDSYLAQLANP